MIKRNKVLNPRFSLKGLYRRYTWNLRSVIAFYPKLFFPIMRLKSRERSWMIREKTQLIIEGFPRSANTFAVFAFLSAQTEKVVISHHMHAPAQVIMAANRDLPTLVLIRKPVDAVLSWIIRYPYKSTSQALKYYIRYYKAIFPFKDKFVLATFEEATSDFGKVIERINKKFGTNFILFNHTEENQRRCFSRMSEIKFKLIEGVDIPEAHLHYPSAHRDNLKMLARDHLMCGKYKSLISEAEKVYRMMLESR